MNTSRIIRDVVHSDIVFPAKYFEIVDSSEFQRLNRIKQLSCEYLVFPGATHTRLSHSIGCYFVMEKLIDHFSQVLHEMGYEVRPEERELALCAALLHDIGHGPFSHTFENIFPQKSHEQWTVDILSDGNTQVHRTLVRNFGRDFVPALTELISKDYAGQQEGGIFSVIATLVSSQVDADRMDYLLRDSYFTSVTNGNYDLNRLIRSLGIEKGEGGRFTIFIHEKFMATLEEYLLARYYMHKEVYQHSVKKQMEGILKKIFQRAGQLHRKGEDLYVHPVIGKLLRGESISTAEYLQLDDNSFVYHIGLWKESEDEILRFLCRAFLDRNKFEKLEGKGTARENEENLKKKLNKAMRAGNKSGIERLEEEYFYLETESCVRLYVNTKENIWVKCRDGRLADLAERSAIINAHSIKIPLENEKRIYFSRELFEKIYGIPLE